MNRLIAVFVVIVGIGAGFGIGRLGETESDEARWGIEETSESSPSNDERGNPIDRSRASEAGEDGPRNASVSAKESATGGGERVRLDAFIADVSSRFADQQLTPLDGDITGWIITEYGEPLAGVQVTISRSNRRSTKQDHADEVDLETYVEQRTQRYLAQDKRTAVSDADGAFSFSDLAGRRYQAEAEADDWILDSSSRSVRPGQTIEFIARRERKVVCSLVLPDGSTPEKARIELKTLANQRRWLEWKPGDATLSLPAQRLDLTAISDEFKSEQVTLDLTGENPPDRVQFALKGRSGIKGRITVPSNERLSQLHITTQSLRDDEEPVFEEVYTRSRQRNSASDRNKDGIWEFEIKDLEPGRTAIGMARTWQRVDHIEIVEIPDGAIGEFDLTLAPIDPATALFVTVHDANGDAVTERCSFNVQMESPGSSQSSGMNAIIVGKRHALMLNDEQWQAFEDSSSILEVTVSNRKHGKKTVVVDSPDITIRLSEAAELIARVNSPSTDAKIQIAVAEPGKNEWDQEFGVEEAGRVYRVENLEPGTFDLRVVVNDIRVENRSVELGSGTNVVDVSIPPLSPLTMRFPQGEMDGQVSLSREGSAQELFSNQRSVPAAGGEIEFGELPSGRYRVSCMRAMDIDFMVVDLPVSGVVEYVPTKVNAFRIDRANEFMQSIGLEEGDVIFGINELRFDNLAEVQIALASAAMSKEATLAVSRDGVERDIAIDGVQLQRLGRDGGSMLPAHYDSNTK